MESATFGVEEEFLLVDAASMRVSPQADHVLEQLPAFARPYVRNELYAVQIETATPVCRDLTELGHWLERLRLATAFAAQSAGCRLVAVGWAPLHTESAAPVVHNPRFARIADELGGLVDGNGMCACHVHVGIDNRDVGALAINHLRPWLPVLQSLSCNSPFADSRDTGYSSWRSMELARWPTVSPPPYLRSAAEYDEIAERLIDTGAIFDRGMIYWFARLSHRYPTIEVRAGDVCLTVDESLLIAALARALVVTAMAKSAAGGCGPYVDDRVLVAAHWRAARDGVEGQGVDVLSGELRPAWELVDRLVEYVRPALEASGDLARVSQLIEAVAAHGSGASRQRAAGGDPHDVARFVVEQTLHGIGIGLPHSTATSRFAWPSTA